MELCIKQPKRLRGKKGLTLLMISLVVVTAFMFFFSFFVFDNSNKNLAEEYNEAELNCVKYGFQNQEVKTIVETAKSRIKKDITYDPSYVSIDYPNGDVPDDTGVCTDVIIRSYRGVGIDLQKLVHEDMSSSFNEYPSKRDYGLNAPDPNIDHRRVINLMKFFEREGVEVDMG